MASFTKLVCFFFLLTTLQTYARDSQFFSQVTRNRVYNTNPNPEYYNNNQETQATPFSKQQEQQPTFVPQTTQVGYGLYGHETGLDAPTTTTTTAATTTNAANPSELYNMNDNQYGNQNNNNNNNYENVEGNSEAEPEFEELSETSYTNNNNNDNINSNVVPKRYVGGNTYNNDNDNNNNNFESNQEAEPEFEELSETSYTNNNNNNNNDNIKGNVASRRYFGGNNNNNNNNNNNKNGHGEYYGGVGYNGGVERQGMSDTRYLENGKYYYDINAEKMSNPTYNNYNNDLSYNNNFENNNYNNDNNNNNSNNNDNVNGVYPGYQSKFPKQDEFEFDDQP